MSDTPPPPLSAEARRMLDMVRDEPVDDAQLRRVRRRVAGLIGVSALTAATSTAKAASALTTKLVAIGTAAVVAVGVTTYVATKSPDAPPAETKTAPVATASAASPSIVVSTVPPPSEPPPPAPASTSAQPSAPIVAPPPPPTAAPPPADTLAAERALLATAQQELSAKNYRKARDTYEHHLAEYPFGALRLEAAVGRVVAMCGMKDPAGQVEAPKLLAKNLPAALANRVRGACGIE